MERRQDFAFKRLATAASLERYRRPLENEMVKIRGPVEPLHVFTNFVSCLVGHDELSWRRAVPRLLKPELFNDAMDAEAANDADTDGPLPSCT